MFFRAKLIVNVILAKCEHRHKVSTGFLVADTMQTSSKGGAGAGSGKNYATGGIYALNSVGSAGNNKNKSWKQHASVTFGDKADHHTATVLGDTKSDKSFGSEAIMVRRSVEIDMASMTDR